MGPFWDASPLKIMWMCNFFKFRSKFVSRLSGKFYCHHIAFICCVERIDAWMRSNRLRMNPSWCGSELDSSLPS